MICFKCSTSTGLVRVEVTPLATYVPDLPALKQLPMAVTFFSCAVHSPLQDVEVHTAQEATAELRALATAGRVEFAGVALVENLSPYVERVLAALYGQDRMVFVSDETDIDGSDIGTDGRHALAKAARKLGIPITDGEPLVDVAARLARKEGALT